MSDDKNNSEPFDFDFDSLNAEPANEASPATNTGESSFDLDNPFGDEVVVTKGVAADGLSDGFAESTGESSFDLGESFGVDLAAPPSDEELSADNPYLDAPVGDADGQTPETKKKGLLGRFAKGKDKPAKEPKAKKEGKNEKVAKEKVPAGEAVPRDWGTILCIAFSAFLLVSLLMMNIAAFFDPNRGTLMQTLCFLGAFNVVGLVAAGIPLLFYKFPKERTLPNVMLGVAAVAIFVGILFAVTDFYRYGFMLGPV
ncbi:MAG: hypothetical protein FWG73_01900 [Planctomycetaceae bacterium]|nr:hypothetical protein [Planctomycetaceae bacterium]